MIDDDVQIGPPFELPLPVSDGRERDDDQERPSDAVSIDLLNKTYALNRFTQAHLICKDATLSETEYKLLLNYFENHFTGI